MSKVFSIAKKLIVEEMEGNKRVTRRQTRNGQMSQEATEQVKNADTENQVQEPSVPVASPRQHVPNTEDSRTGQGRQESDHGRNVREHS